MAAGVFTLAMGTQQTPVAVPTAGAADHSGFVSRHCLSCFHSVRRDRQSLVRFAVWDSAGNGAFTQPSWLNAPTARTTTGAK
jgi:hypothetical protein